MEFGKLILGIAAISMAGCATVDVQETLVPVPVLVKINKPDRPLLASDSAKTEEDRTRAAKIDVLIMKKYVLDLETLIDKHDKTVPILPAGISMIRE